MKAIFSIALFTFAALILALLVTTSSSASPFDGGMIEYTQPCDTVKFDAHLWGDEFIYWFMTDDEYEIIQGEDGYYYYAVLDSIGEYTVSVYKVGIDNPSQHGIYTNLQRSTSRLDTLEQRWIDFNLWLSDTTVIADTIFSSPSQDGGDIGRDESDDVDDITINLLLIDFTEPIRGNYTGQDYLDMFNSLDYTGEDCYPEDPGGASRVGYGSIRQYWREMSHYSEGDDRGVDITCQIVNNLDENDEPIWIQLPEDKDYYDGRRLHDTYIAIRDQCREQEPEIRNYGTSVHGRSFLILLFAGEPGNRTLRTYTDMAGPTVIISEMERRGPFLRIGTYCHEMGHALFRFEDTYLQGFGYSNIYNIGLMGYGCKNGSWGACPAPLAPQFRAEDAQHNYKVPWVTVSVLEEDQVNMQIEDDENGLGPIVYAYELVYNNRLVYIEKRDFTGFNLFVKCPGDNNNCELILWGQKMDQSWIPMALLPTQLYDNEDDRGNASSIMPGPGSFMVANAVDHTVLDNHDRVYGINTKPSIGNDEGIQTGFSCEIEDIDDTDMWLNIRTNDWSGDIEEDLTLEGDNIYLSEDCTILDGYTVTIDGSNETPVVNLDDDVDIESGGTLAIDPDGDANQNVKIYLNDFTLDQESGGSFDIAPGPDNEQVTFYGPGEVEVNDWLIEDVKVTFDDADGEWQIEIWDDITIADGGSLYLKVTQHGSVCRLLLHGDIIVEDGGYLFLQTPVEEEPGANNAKLWIKGSGQIVIRGGAEMAGTVNAPIVCTSDETIPAADDWQGIEFEDITTTSTLKYVDIEYVVNGIKAEDCGSYLDIQHVNITNFSSTGFYLVNSSPTIDSCSASDSEPSGSTLPIGLYCYNSSPTVTYSEFDNNYKGVEVIGLSSALSMGYCSVSDNDAAGITFTDGMGYLYYTMTSPMGYNHILSNGTGVYVSGFGSPYMGNGSLSPGYNSIYSNSTYDVNNSATSGVQAEYNWWNNVLGPTHNYGTVEGDPWETSSPGGGPSPSKPSGNGQIAGMDDGDDDIFSYADSLFDEGEFGDALDAYSEIIGERPDAGSVLRAIRQMRVCYRHLDRDGHWRDFIAGQADNRDRRAAIRPAIAGMLAQARLADDANAALNLLISTLRNLQVENVNYPTLMFQLGMVQHYTLNDPDASTRTFGRFLELFEDHPLYQAAELEYAESVRDAEGNIDSPHSPGQDELEVDAVPTEYHLHPPYPNPFNDIVTIRYAVPEVADVKLILYDAMGREVLSIKDEQHQVGIHEAQLSGAALKSGVYFCKMVSSTGFDQTTKLVYMK